MTSRRLNGLLAVLVVGHLLLAAAYGALNPLGEAPDEADHWSYIIHLYVKRALPVGPKITQSKHPPLYHLTAALAASLGEVRNDFLRSNPDVELSPPDSSAAKGSGWSPNFFIHTRLEDWPWHGGALGLHLARGWSVLLSTAAVAAAFALVRVALPRRPAVALAAAGVLAFLPEFAFIGSAVNNDGMAALFGTLALWAGLKVYRAPAAPAGVVCAVLAGAALGLGLLTKTSTLALWPVVGAALVLGAARAAAGQPATLGAWADGAVRSWRRWLGHGLLVFLPALAIAAPWLLRNWRLYGDPLGMTLVQQTVDLRTAPWIWADTRWLLRGWFLSFWGKFGGAGHIPMASSIYALLAALTALSLLGLLRWLWRGRDERLPVLLLAAAVLSTAAVMGRYSLLALGTDQGRLLYPAVAALLALWVLGLFEWVGLRGEPAAAAALVVGSLALGLYGLFGVILPAFAPPASAATVESAAAAAPVTFGELELVGWTLAPEPILYWRAEAEPTQDWRTTLRVLAPDGTLVWEWRRSPGAGRWSTDRWAAGVVVEDVYLVRWPDWAGPGRYRVEVGLQPFGGELVTPVGPRVGGENPYLFLGEIERAAGE